LGPLQIERDALLALVVLVEVAAAVRTGLEVGERRQETRHARAGRGPDADDLGAEMRELEGAEGPGPHPGAVGDADAGARAARRRAGDHRCGRPRSASRVAPRDSRSGTSATAALPALPMISTRTFHWCPSTQQRKIHPSRHSMKQRGWMGLAPRREARSP